MTWKDTTSFSQGDKLRTPTTWSAEAGVFRVIVTRGHINYRGKWIMHIYPGVLDCHDLKLKADATPEQAQVAAEMKFRDILTTALGV